MKWLLVASLSVLLLGAPRAHAVSGKGNHGLSGQGTSSANSVTKTNNKGSSLHGRSSDHKLILTPPVRLKEPEVGALGTIKSLATGESLVNPWMPGRGAIGVKVKVTW